MSNSIRVNFPLIGSVKVKLHNTDSKSFFLKSYSDTAFAALREYIPEIGEQSEVGYKRFAASVSQEAFIAKASAAHLGLGQKALAAMLVEIEAKKVALPNDAAMTADFVSNLAVRLTEKAEAAASYSAPAFGVIDGGDSDKSYESETDESDDSGSDDDENDTY